METLALLVDVDVARREAEHKAAALVGIAIVRRRVDVEPDMVHVREVAADLFDHAVAVAVRAETRALQHAVRLQLRLRFKNHLDIRVEAAGRHHDGLRHHLDFLAGLRVAALEAGDAAAVVTHQGGDLGIGDQLAALAAIGRDQPRHQAEAALVGARPTDDGVALLRLGVDPFDAMALAPVIEVVQRVLDVEARPLLIRRGSAPLHPVVEREIGCVDNAHLLLQRRADDQAAPARDDRSPSRIGAFFERHHARAIFERVEPRSDSSSATADDGDVGFVLFGLGFGGH